MKYSTYIIRLVPEPSVMGVARACRKCGGSHVNRRWACVCWKMRLPKRKEK